ncbi:MAG: hypothetical protein AAB963_01260, partial [Patescibacteria group bacterium]
MNSYLVWNKKIISNLSDETINRAYAGGFLFTREGKGKMYQTRSVRIDLEKFELSSENRRILRKITNFKFQISNLPMVDYDWKIG